MAEFEPDPYEVVHYAVIAVVLVYAFVSTQILIGILLVLLVRGSLLAERFLRSYRERNRILEARTQGSRAEDSPPVTRRDEHGAFEGDAPGTFEGDDPGGVGSGESGTDRQRDRELERERSR